ncbi:hypothetical protein D3C84_1021390 [compost metagenome]
MREFLFVQRLAGLLEQGFEQAAFGNRQGELLFIDADHTAHRAETQVAQLDLAGRRRRMAAAQHGAQTGCQFPRVAGFGQIVVGTELQTKDAVQGFAAG